MIDKDQLREFDKLWKCDEWGKWSRYFNTKRGVKSFGLKFKEGRGIKVFVSEKFTFENLREYCIINTYFAYYNLSPKLYDWGQQNGYYYIEVEDVKGRVPDNCDDFCNSIFDLYATIDWIVPYGIDLTIKKNYKDGKYLDFHGFKINWNKFGVWWCEQIKKSHWGKLNNADVKFAYQTNDLSVGKRSLKQRVKEMKLEAVDFRDRTVLDIGCNLGVMGYFAELSGATVLGVDCFEDFKLLADIYKYFRMIRNIEFIDCKLTPDNIDQFGKFDIVFYFAMVHSLGYPKKLKDITKELLIFEGHNEQDKDEVKIKLNEIFKVVDFIGYTTDRGKRPVFYCRHS